MADINDERLQLLSVSMWRRGKNLDVGVVEEFRVTGCAQHFSEDLTGMDWVVGVFYFDGSLVSIFSAFSLVEPFCLRLTIIGSGRYFESNFIVGTIPCYHVFSAKKAYLQTSIRTGTDSVGPYFELRCKMTTSLEFRETNASSHTCFAIQV